MRNNVNIPTTAKDKLFKMIFLLFPMYGLVKMTKGGFVTLRQRKLFSRGVKLSLLDLILYYIPNEISLARWGNYDLTYGYVAKVVDIMHDSKYTEDARLDIAISYLYSEFVHTKIRNIYTDINEVIIPNEQGHLSYVKCQRQAIPEAIKERIEEAVIVKGTEFSFMKRLNVVNKIPYEIRYMAASLLLTVMLNYNIISTTLSGTRVIHTLINYPIIQQFPWTIIKNTS